LAWTDSSLIKLFYRFLFYFELGKNNTARIYQFIPDIVIILGGLKYLLNFNITPTFTIIFALIIVILFTFLGIFINKSGLYKTDKIIQTGKDPVMNEVYQAALKINKK